MKYEATGLIHFVGETETFASGFKKRIIVLDTSEANSKYRNFAVFEFNGDRSAFLDKFKVGQFARVRFFINANESRTQPGRWFCSLNGSEIELTNQYGETKEEQVARIVTQANATAQSKPSAVSKKEEEDDDEVLPF